MSLIDEMNAALSLLYSNNRRLVETILAKEFGGAQGAGGLSEVEAQQVWAKPRFRVSPAAELMSIHPQTLRQYDRMGLVVPGRTGGGGRRYSLRDLARLHQVQSLSQGEGVNLEGIRRIMALQRRVDELEAENAALTLAANRQNRVFAASSSGEVTKLNRGQRPEKTQSLGFPLGMSSQSGALVVWGQ